MEEKMKYIAIKTALIHVASLVCLSKTPQRDILVTTSYRMFDKCQNVSTYIYLYNTHAYFFYDFFLYLDGINIDILFDKEHIKKCFPPNIIKLNVQLRMS